MPLEAAMRESEEKRQAEGEAQLCHGPKNGLSQL